MSSHIARAFLIDLDGVLYVQETVVPGAIDTVRYLQAKEIPHRFVTNTTSRSRRQLLEILRTLGINLSLDHLYTPALAAAQYLRELPGSRCFFYTNKDVLEDFEGIEHVDSKPTHVIIGDVGHEFSYEAMNRAFRFIMAGAGILTLQKNRYWLTKEGLTLDAGAFVAALEFATGKAATVFGKPAPQFFLQACSSLRRAAPEVTMIGDDLKVDIEGARAVGMRTLFVRTGKDKDTAFDAVGEKPDLILDSIAELPVALGLA